MVCNKNIITSHLFQDSLPGLVMMVPDGVDQVARQGTG
jgi:intracellular sulfur oxidation DsrE/DsrF family protein